MKKTVFNSLLFIFLLFAIHGVGFAQSPQVDPTKSLTCMITTDFYIVHLTSYQEPEEGARLKKRKKFEPFCQELPKHGLSFLAIDFIDRDIRKMPVGMRVIEKLKNPEGGEMLEGAVISEVAAQSYKNGVAQIQADFPKPGHYALVVTVGDDMFADKIHIPLRVGIGSAWTWATFYPFLFAILLAAVGYAIYRFSLYRHNLKTKDKSIKL